MGRIATTIAVSYTAVSVLAIVFIVLVGLSTRSRARADEAALGKLGEREKTWFAIVVVLLAALLFATIFFTPYGRSAGRGGQVVDVQAVQFAWLLPSQPIRAGRPVEFRLNSRDVSHGFAVYTRAGKLLFQVQVLPGRTQKYVYTFRHPGTYKVLCLEFCGLGHDKMQAQLTVQA